VRNWPRPRLALVVVVVLVVLIGYPILLGLTAWSHLNRIDALAPAHKVTDTAETPGRTYLVVGSDSRSDLSAAEKKKLGTGSAAGQRTDTIMLLHVPSGGGPTVLVSVPRDSYVSIPGHSKNKINAAYAYGGAPLLVRTLEQASGLRIDDYVETGLGGFASIVDALGGVTLCPKFAMKDHDAHINLKKGCQPMDGKTALGYARARHSDPRGDLGRVERQRETLAAIAKKMLSPTTLIQPWRALPAAKAGGGALTVDKGTSPLGLAHFVLAMRAVAGGNGVSMTVPVSNPDFRTPAGASAVLWDRAKALELFADLKADNTKAVKVIADAQKTK
jgi:LCP family protein required for cell wall assembly